MGILLFEKGGVFVHTTVARPDEDALVAGKLVLIQRTGTRFIEWRQTSNNEPKEDWTMLSSVQYKNNSGSQSVHMQSVSPPAPVLTPEHPRYVINFDIEDLKSFKRSKPNLGWSYLIFILKDGTTYPALHFHQGGSKDFIRQLESFLNVKKSPHDSCLFLVKPLDPKALKKSFDELHLFEEQSGDMVSKFMQNPMRTTISGFSRVTHLLRDTLLQPPQEPQAAAQFNRLLETEDFSNIDVMLGHEEEVPGFEIVFQSNLPPRPECSRGDPVSPQLWSHHMDQDGCIRNKDDLLEAIFRGGIEPSIRTEVWKFLLGYYQWDSTYTSRTEKRKEKVDKYFAMKLQWKSVIDEQKKRFAIYRERQNLIEKDVTRTDRSHHFFQGENNPNLSVLYDVLFTYCMYNFDLGYVQGMSDLLAPILVVMENEVDAFWCFAGFMDKVERNFEEDQKGMKTQLHQLHMLIRMLDPQLCNHLESHDSGNMFFCFRWVLIWFKREFPFSDIMRLWEVMWTGLPCKNFHLLMCCAILDSAKTTILENQFGFTEVLKHINDLSNTIDLDATLNKAEGIHKQLKDCKDLPEEIGEIIGLQNPNPSSRSSPARASPRRTPSNQPRVSPASTDTVSSSNTTQSPVTAEDITTQDHDNSIQMLSDFH